MPLLELLAAVSHLHTAGTPPPHKYSTASHPPPTSPDPTLTTPPSAKAASENNNATAQGRLPAARPTPAAELARLTLNLRSSLRQFPDFPSPGILFEDILPIFANPSLHADLIRALELHVLDTFGAGGVDVVVGLEARGFLFGPSLALRVGAAFVPVRKMGKLPGECVREGYVKEYGTDWFEMQGDAVKAGQRVVVVDDIIATGGSAAAAGSLVKKLGGTLLEYVFMLELDFLKGREKLDAPVYTLLSSQEKK
ncbi:adenine phosphoribosyltransferase [Byssothecium circinans]|uniref:adenine phosphoribosyltransferase n=1 Tax=Byssothecium circinans TaxID=147558 RepID=A0A6A5U146_9PLEO|nr:adenine phosphoribosyltransferase [Byssothecium circinans]